MEKLGSIGGLIICSTLSIICPIIAFLSLPLNSILLLASSRLATGIASGLATFQTVCFVTQVNVLCKAKKHARAPSCEMLWLGIYRASQYLNIHALVQQYGRSSIFFCMKVSPRWCKLILHLLPVGLSTGLLAAYTLGQHFLLGSDQVPFQMHLSLRYLLASNL